MKEWLLVLRAADAAARWHVHQRRKGSAEEPYVNHLVEVAMLVAEATDGKDPDLVIAALLHDAIEDCEVPKELIAETFGDDVASLVVEVTDDKSLPKQVRKDKQIETAMAKSPRAKVLKLADKASNLRAVAAKRVRFAGCDQGAKRTSGEAPEWSAPLAVDILRNWN
jgi:(p)ppGpp synthase/HD superfamily hydrolase